MDHNDKQAIDGLFGKLALVEQQGVNRDPEADRFIAERIARQPGAPYFMAQTIVVQEQALNAAQARIEELEHQVRNAPQGGGVLSRMFGGGAAPAPAPRRAPATGYGAGPSQGPSSQGGPFQSGGRQMPGQGGGFLAGAAQTAMGVAGGVLLGNALMGMLGGPAEAAPPPAEDQPQDEEEDYADPGTDEGDWGEE